VPKKLNAREELAKLSRVPDTEARQVWAKVPIPVVRRLFQACLAQEQDLSGLVARILAEHVGDYLVAAHPREGEGAMDILMAAGRAKSGPARVEALVRTAIECKYSQERELVSVVAHALGQLEREEQVVAAVNALAKEGKVRLALGQGGEVVFVAVERKRAGRRGPRTDRPGGA
jgi:hypothetical protein